MDAGPAKGHPATDSSGFRIRDGRRVLYRFKGDDASPVEPLQGVTSLREAVVIGATIARSMPAAHAHITREVSRRIEGSRSVSTVTSHDFRVYGDGSLELYWHRQGSRGSRPSKGFATWVALAPRQEFRISRQQSALVQLQDLAHVAERMGYSHAHRALARCVGDEMTPPDLAEVLRAASARARKSGQIAMAISIEAMIEKVQPTKEKSPRRMPLMRRFLQGLVGS